MPTLKFKAAHASIAVEQRKYVLPDLVVLSGTNGSGKTHFLEAIANGAIEASDTPGEALPLNVPRVPISRKTTRLYGFGSLQAKGGTATKATSERAWKSVLDSIAKGQKRDQNSRDPLLIGAVGASEVRSADHLTYEAIESIENRLGKKLEEMSIDELVRWVPPLVTDHDPFVSSIAQVFVNYYDRRNHHAFREWKAKNGQSTNRNFLPENEFLRLFGPPPWELLSEALQAVGLPYRFLSPEGWEDSGKYLVTLTDERRRAEVSVERLSTGERTLLALAMSLYASEAGETNLSLPRLLLLDEPDASLHPSMVTDLLRVMETLLIGERGIKVIMTTHSPTTVALAPEDSLYLIERDHNPRVFRASRDDCLARLTVGIPTLSVKVENRRQVFVESKRDAALYEQVFGLLRRTNSWPFSLQFVSVGHPHGGCDEVIRLVTELRAAGSVDTFGLVDRDIRTEVDNGVVFSSAMYSIENFILNPLALGTFMLRERMKAPTELGLQEGALHYRLESADAQVVARTVSELLAGDGASAPDRDLPLSDGTVVRVHSYVCEEQGHSYEAHVLSTFPCLNATRGRLMENVVLKAFGDSPGHIPAAMRDLLGSLAGDTSFT